MSDLTDYFLAALTWLGYIWGGLIVGAFCLYFVICAKSGAGEAGSSEEGDE